MTPSLHDRLALRARVLRDVRDYFDASGALEISTPTLVANPGNEVQLRAFPVHTRSHAFEGARYLHTSPEFAIKACLAELQCDVYAFARSYRDEPRSRWHAPEFTMLEWYRATDNEDDVVRDVDAVVRIAHRAAGVEPGWPTPRRVSLLERFSRLGVDARQLDRSALFDAAQRAGVSADEGWDAEALFTLLYAEVVEPSLTPREGASADAPVVLHDFPAHQAALAELGPDGTARRFEVYLPVGDAVVELANAFVELRDPIEQRARFTTNATKRAALGEPVYPSPERMLAGIEVMPPTVGIALGVERLLSAVAARAHGWETGVSDWFAT